MSRTIRCNQRFLLIWSIPELGSLTQQTNAYRQQLLPGLYVSKDQPLRLRLAQTDRHQTQKCGYGYHKREYNRRYRKLWRKSIHSYMYYGDFDLCRNVKLYYPYM